MGGIPLINLGAMPALPSPATGIPKVNPIAQLGQEATQIPKEMAQQQSLTDQNALRQQALQDAQRKVIQDRYDRNIQLVKNNPALKGNAGLVAAIQADAKALGVVAPITDGGQSSVPGASATAIPASSDTGANPSGGAAPGGGAPQQEGGMGAPLNMPPAAAGATGAAPGAAPLPSAGAAPGLAPVASEGSYQNERGPEVDMAAITPHVTLDTLQSNPDLAKLVFSLEPDQRRAAFPNLPDAVLNAKKTWSTEDTQHEMTRRMFVQQLLKNGDPKSISSTIAFLQKDDPQGDWSQYFPASTFSDYNAIQKKRLDLMVQSGILKQDEYQARLKKIDADIQMMQTTQGLRQWQTQEAQERAQMLPAQMQADIDAKRAAITNSTKNAATNASRLQEMIAQNKWTQVSKTKGQAIQARGQLQANIDSLRRTSQNPAFDPDAQVTGEDGTPTTAGELLANQINAAQEQIDALNKQIGIADSPQTAQSRVQSQFPNAAKVSTAPDLAAKIKAFYGGLSAEQKKAYYNDPRLPADVRAQLTPP